MVFIFFLLNSQVEHSNCFKFVQEPVFLQRGAQRWTEPFFSSPSRAQVSPRPVKLLQTSFDLELLTFFCIKPMPIKAYFSSKAKVLVFSSNFYELFIYKSTEIFKLQPIPTFFIRLPRAYLWQAHNWTRAVKSEPSIVPPLALHFRQFHQRKRD